MNSKILHISIIGIFVLLYLFVSIISMIHVVDFFELSNSRLMSISLAIAFEIGAAASLASIIVMDRMKKGIVWSLFILLTLMQIMGNMYNSYSNLAEFQQWIELFGLEDKPIIFQKRILAAISGMPLPLIALGFIKALTDYIRPTRESSNNNDTESYDMFFSGNNNSISNNDTEMNDKENYVEENAKVTNENVEATSSLDENVEATSSLDENFIEEVKNEIQEEEKKKEETPVKEKPQPKVDKSKDVYDEKNKNPKNLTDSEMNQLQQLYNDFRNNKK